MSLVVLVLVVSLAYFVCTTQASAIRVGVPCLFRSDELDLHKYSGILAAVEPVRKKTDETIRKCFAFDF